MLSNSFFDHIISKDGQAIGRQSSKMSVFHADSEMDTIFLKTLSWCMRFTNGGDDDSEDSEES